MIELIALIGLYRCDTDPVLAETRAFLIYCKIEPELLLLVLGQIHSRGLSASDAPDVMQETLKAIFQNLLKFRGKTEEEFWGWCNRIAMNKVNDCLRKRIPEENQEISLDGLEDLIEASAESAPLSPQDRLDLEYAMNLLSKSKPECREFLWTHYVIGKDYGEMAEEFQLKYDAVRMKISRCLETARAVLAV